MIQILISDLERKDDLTIHEMLILLVYSGTCLSAVCTMIMFLTNNSQFISGLENLNNADILMKQLRINVPYILPTYLAIGQVLFSVLGLSVILAYELLIIGKTWTRIYHEKVSYHFSIVILTTANYHYIGVIILLYLRIKKINIFLENLEEESELNVDNKYLYNKRSIIYNMRTIIDLYDELISCGKKINEVFSFSLFCFIQLMTLGLLGQMFSFLSPSHVFSTQTNIVGFVTYGLLLLPILIPSEFTMIETKKTTGLVGLITTCYYDDKAAVERNTFLLQSLHHKLNLNACGIHTLCIGTLIKQINAMNAFLIFFLQIQPHPKTID